MLQCRLNGAIFLFIETFCLSLKKGQYSANRADQYPWHDPLQSQSRVAAQTKAAKDGIPKAIALADHPSQDQLDIFFVATKLHLAFPIACVVVGQHCYLVPLKYRKGKVKYII